ncbi:hypothetical protein HG530_010672 [Fusarium avenaceum]|nr:hypothetical protein HG530_010672 [Fusarium avenaceum]
MLVSIPVAFNLYTIVPSILPSPTRIILQQLPHRPQRLLLHILDFLVNTNRQNIPLILLRPLQHLKLTMHQRSTREMALSRRGSLLQDLLRRIKVQEVHAQIPRILCALAKNVAVLSL